jgi:hypothetical protein
LIPDHQQGMIIVQQKDKDKEAFFIPEARG